MKKSRMAALLGAALFCGLLTLARSGVAWPAAETSRRVVVIWSGDDQWVRLERQDSPTASPNDHPAALSAAAVANALGSLQIRVVDPSSSAETQRDVFARDELDRLAPHVAAGLAKAGPRQDVTFSTIGSHAVGGGLLKDPGVNAGRVFYEDGKLNVIFGELQANYRKRNLYGRRDQDFEPRRQGARDKANKQKWSLATRPGIALARDDWVTIDPAVANGQPSPAAAAKPAARTEMPSTAARPTGDLERRLQVLKDLRDKGLITEEAYNSKVQELLSEL